MVIVDGLAVEYVTGMKFCFADCRLPVVGLLVVGLARKGDGKRNFGMGKILRPLCLAAKMVGGLFLRAGRCVSGRGFLAGFVFLVLSDFCEIFLDFFGFVSVFSCSCVG